MGGLDQITLEMEELTVEGDYNIPFAPGKGFNTSPNKGLDKWLKSEAKKYGVDITDRKEPVDESEIA